MLHLTQAELMSPLWLRVVEQLKQHRARVLESLAVERDPVLAAELRGIARALNSLIEAEPGEWPE